MAIGHPVLSKYKTSYKVCLMFSCNKHNCGGDMIDS